MSAEDVDGGLAGVEDAEPRLVAELQQRRCPGLPLRPRQAARVERAVQRLLGGALLLLLNFIVFKNPLRCLYIN